MTSAILRLTDIDFIECTGTGTEAESFLQSLLCNDVRELDSQNSQWTALLTPQGRVLAVMALLRLEPQHYLLAVPKQRGLAILDLLKRFILRRKLQLRLAPEYAMLGTDADSEAPGQTLRLTMASGRRWLLNSIDAASHFPASGVSWHLADLQDGLPFLTEATSAKHLAHSLRLDSLPAIHFKKGCYPGQEIVVRTHFLGRNKRRLCLLMATSVVTEGLAIGQQIRTQEGTLAGDIVDIERDNNHFLLLAVMALELLPLPLFWAPQGSEPSAVKILTSF